MSTPHLPGLWIDPVTGQAYDALTMNPVTFAGADLGEKPRAINPVIPPLNDDDLEEFARQLAGRAKLPKTPGTPDNGDGGTPESDQDR